MKTDNISQAISYAHRLLNYRPRSEKEIRNRLIYKGFDRDTVDSVVSQLKEKSFIDDYGFARLWAGSRLQNSGQGFIKTKQELLQKGISEDIIDDIIIRIKENFDEYDSANSLIKRRLVLMTGLDRGKALQRLYAYLKRRGFSGDTIRRILNETYPDTR
jgi:regulatory protein